MLSILEYGNLLAPFINTAPIWLLVLSTTGILVTFAVLLNILRQILNFDSNEPPLVFHVLPWIGNTIEYGIDPYAFFFSCQARYGDVFTFVLLGKKTTVCLGIKGNDLILNGKLKDVNAEEIYSTLTTPVFGKGVVYDCPNSKLLEQKKFVKFGLSSSALRSHVELITAETRSFFSEAAPSKRFLGTNGSFNVPPTLAELTIYTASRSLQGKEVREKFDAGFAGLFHDLDGGFVPINFKLGWLPLPHNRKRDAAQRKMAEIYMEIIRQRRESGTVDSNAREKDMIWNLMNCSYKDGEPIPDREIAHMMIALLMGGHHSSSSTISWILLRLASRMDIQEDLLEEQRKVLGVDDDGLIRDFQYDDLENLSLHAHVVKETLRLHAPIHSVMRVVKNPIRVTGTRYIIPTSNVLLASPGVTSRVGEHFPEPLLWEPHRWDALAGKYPGLSPRHLTEDLVEGKEDFGLGTTGKGATSPYLPFGAGRHRCIGEKFAYVQLQTILATVVRNFKFHHSGRKEEIIGTDYSSLFTGPLNPATVAWERRREPSEDIAKQG